MKQKRRRILAAGTLIGAVIWLTTELYLVPENRVARLSLLTAHPEIRWMKGGSFLLALLSSIGLTVDVGYEKLLPQIQPFLETVDTVFKDPLTWLILALTTYTAYTPEIRQSIQNTTTLVAGTNLLIILYLTSYTVIKK